MLSKTDILFILLGVWFSYLSVTWSELDNIFRFYFHFHMKENQILYLEQEKHEKTLQTYAFSLA